MRFGYLLIILLCFIFIAVRADDLEQDTIRLEGITITGSFFERFSAGSQIHAVDSVKLLSFSTLNLNDLVRSEAPIHFKSYGNGMLTSVSFRGTGAGHTAVMWNGINVNQPTVGQTDFSLFPVVAFDQVKLHFGAASSRYGSEALGGAVLLDSKPEWNMNKVQGNISAYGGRYGHDLMMGKTAFKPWKNLLSTTKFYRNRNTNNFKYHNITKPGKPIEQQENASVLQYGLIQDLYLITSGSSQLSVKSWFNYSDREIQPTMSNTDGNESQKDKSFRISADYHVSTPIGFFDAKMGYLWDYLMYNQQSLITTGQWIGQLGYEHDLAHWKFRVGVNYNHIGAVSDNYDNKQEEDRTGIYGGVVYSGLGNMNISFNFKQQFISGFEPPLAPSLGIQYEIPLSSNSRMILDGQASLNYRVPTLNDRFWQPGGRPDLKPEQSQNVEGTISYDLKADFHARISLTGFYYRVEDWILWVPAGNFWAPDNVRQVNASGLEIKSGLTFPIGKTDLDFNGFYSLTHSIIGDTGDEDDRSEGNQLPYTPVHLAGMNLTWTSNQWSAAVYGNMTGQAFVTTDNQTGLPGYFLVHLQGSRKFRINRQLLALDIRIDNLLDKDYQSVLYRAMPGRTYVIGLQFYFKK
ncbi:MAG: TonB-dependent receptor [Cyclobacteriaceae bacterium]|nr:TonB-dependent receptor [Cyclobacteriaceae bacterium]